MKARYIFQKKSKSAVAFSLLLIFFNSCKKFIQVSPPNTQIVTASVFNNNSTASSALTTIYSQMFTKTESYNIAYNQGLLADELTNYSTDPTEVQFYTNAMVAINPNGQWGNGYNYIYQANAVIEALQNNGNISPAIVKQLTGEAKFIRAFWHFYLTNEYGDIPLITTTAYNVNAALARTPQAKVFTQIIQDLIDAETLLSANYVKGTDTTITTERTRPIKAAAQAFLARVYLYTQKYDSAETQASLVINNNLFSLCQNLSPLTGANSVFLINSSEAIWQLATPQPNGVDTYDGQYFILQGAPNTSGYTNSSTISPQLLNSFEAGDQRRLNWIDSIVEGSSIYYFPYKYQVYNANLGLEYTMVLRLAEQYLIRSEAEANLGDMQDAANDLNIIRNRAGLGLSTTLTASSNLQEADSAIMHERQVELFTEWGHRWFDLKRIGIINFVMGNPENVCQFKGGVWNQYDQLYPIPQNEILSDPNLIQNTGY